MNHRVFLAKSSLILDENRSVKNEDAGERERERERLNIMEITSIRNKRSIPKET